MGGSIIAFLVAALFYGGFLVVTFWIPWNLVIAVLLGRSQDLDKEIYEANMCNEKRAPRPPAWWGPQTNWWDRPIETTETPKPEPEHKQWWCIPRTEEQILKSELYKRRRYGDDLDADALYAELELDDC